MFTVVRAARDKHRKQEKGGVVFEAFDSKEILDEELYRMVLKWLKSRK